MDWNRDTLAQLRGAVYRGDGPEVVAALRDHDITEVLQLAGDGLLAAQDVDGAAPLASACVARLRERDLPGDQELGDALEGHATGLRPLAVDLDELTALLDGDPLRGGGRIDLHSGEIWHGSPYDDPWEDDEEPDDEDRWLSVEAGSRKGWLDMQEFAGTVTDPALGERLQRAIAVRGAFRRFRAALDDHPSELSRFERLAEDRQRGRARRWLAEHGLRPA